MRIEQDTEDKHTYHSGTLKNVFTDIQYKTFYLCYAV